MCSQEIHSMNIFMYIQISLTIDMSLYSPEFASELLLVHAEFGDVGLQHPFLGL